MATKKELKDAYKLMKFKVGVFQIRNLVNNKIFIDSSVNLDKIWNRHRVELNFGNHRNEQLQKEWKEWGETNFAYEILSEIEQKNDQTTDLEREAKLLAQMYIEELKPFDDSGYNTRL